MKTAVIGSQSVIEMDLSEYMPKQTSTIVCGDTKHIDSSAKNYAKENNLHTIIISADYSQYGDNVSQETHKQIVDSSDVVVAFWDVLSSDTKQAIDYARSIGKKVILYMCLM